MQNVEQLRAEILSLRQQRDAAARRAVDEGRRPVDDGHVQELDAKL